MSSTVEAVVVLGAALPGVYGAVCGVRRALNAQRAARWARTHHEAEWKDLHWLARRSAWASVEVLARKGLISGREVDEFRARDEYLEKATWVGLFVSALLLFLIILLKIIVGMLH